MNKVYEITFCRKTGITKGKIFKVKFNSLSELAKYIVDKDSVLYACRLQEELAWKERTILFSKIVSLYQQNN